MSKKKAYIGIDPGASGALCLLIPREKHIEFVDTKESIKISDWLNELSVAYDVMIILIEDVHSIHGTSAKSNFNFGRNLGKLEALMEVSEIGFDRILPRAWQSKCNIKVPQGITGNARKKLLKKNTATKCKELYPNADIYGPKGGLLDGKSDSLMIAHAAYLIYN